MRSGTGARASASAGPPPRPPRTSRRLPLAWLALAATVIVPAVARAESPCAGDPAVCLNSDTFWPSPGPARLAGVSGTQTTNAGELSIGLVTSYQSRPIALRTASPGPSGASAETFAIDDQVTTNFLWQYGITPRLGFDAALPITLGQGGAGLSALTGGSGVKFTAIRDLRFGVAFAVIPRARVDVETSQKAFWFPRDWFASESARRRPSATRPISPASAPRCSPLRSRATTAWAGPRWARTSARVCAPPRTCSGRASARRSRRASAAASTCSRASGSPSSSRPARS
jgi:hypothetical protein